MAEELSHGGFVGAFLVGDELDLDGGIFDLRFFFFGSINWVLRVYILFCDELSVTLHKARHIV